MNESKQLNPTITLLGTELRYADARDSFMEEAMKNPATHTLVMADMPLAKPGHFAANIRTWQAHRHEHGMLPVQIHVVFPHPLDSSLILQRARALTFTHENNWESLFEHETIAAVHEMMDDAHEYIKDFKEFQKHDVKRSMAILASSIRTFEELHLIPNVFVYASNIASHLPAVFVHNDHEGIRADLNPMVLTEESVARPMENRDEDQSLMSYVHPANCPAIDDSIFDHEGRFTANHVLYCLDALLQFRSNVHSKRHGWSQPIRYLVSMFLKKKPGTFQHGPGD